MSAIDDYLSKLDPVHQTELERVRKIVHNTVPDAQEVISYAMPGFKYKNRYLVGFNAHPKHFALYPTSSPIEALKTKLEPYSLSKGTIRYTPDKPLSEPLIKQILRYKADEIDRK